jgi:hypothetical protein
MKVQILQDNKGNETGVFVPIEDWNLIKREYPEVETLSVDISEYEKAIIDERLQTISLKPERILNGTILIDELNKK